MSGGQRAPRGLDDWPASVLSCDVADCGSGAGGEGTLAELREWAASTGWTSRDGRDYCPRHRDAS